MKWVVCLTAVAVGLSALAGPVRGNPPVNTAVPDKNDPYWAKALSEVYRSADELKAQDVREQRRGLVLPKLRRGNSSLKMLALTFDDGPHPAFTPQLLDLLGTLKVKATFFVVGKMAEKSPDLIRRMVAEGHSVGNHTFSHVTLTKVPYQVAVVEYRANNDLLQKITGERVRFCRPPGGDYDEDVIKAATECNLTTVLWTDDPGDYAAPGSQILEQRTLSRLSNGGIVLLHDGGTETLKLLPQLVSYAQKKGYKFVTVDELQAALRQRPRPGTGPDSGPNPFHSKPPVR
jgi:peptidoglycan/xylan/chitin deacetylase (PgdA/CDA1 family)